MCSSDLVPSAIKSMGLPKGHNKCEMFVISDPDMEMFLTFGDYLKKTIEASPEWQGLKNRVKTSQPAGSGFDDVEDDIPF